MKQVYTVKKEGNNRVFLYNRGVEAICPQTAIINEIRHCGDWCPMFEFTDNDKFRGEPWAKVTLYCCGRMISVEVVE